MLETSVEADVIPFAPADRTSALGLKQTISCWLVELWLLFCAIFEVDIDRSNGNWDVVLHNMISIEGKTETTENI